MSQEQYGEDYFKDTYGVDGLKRFSSHWFSAKYYADVSRRFLKEINGSRFLEIGCGHGFVLNLLQDRFRVNGIDLSEYAINNARKYSQNASLSVANIEDEFPADLKENSFDLILAKYVLEHLKRPDKAVFNVFKLLKPGGVFFFSVPNLESWGKKIKGSEWYAFKDPTHVSLFSPEKWLRITEEAGFIFYKEFSDGYWDLPYFKGIPMFIQKIIFLLPTALMCLSGRPFLPARFGENVLMVVRKPEDIL